jgi:hypothetical protein
MDVLRDEGSIALLQSEIDSKRAKFRYCTNA